MRISRTFHIDSAHLIPGHPRCGRLHGHTYRIELVLEGPVGEDGMVVDFGALKERVTPVLEPMDHAFLNDLLPVTTVEAIAQYLLDRLKGDIPHLHAVRVWEGVGKYAEASLRNGAS